MTPALDLTSCLASGWAVTPSVVLRVAAAVAVIVLAAWCGSRRIFTGRPALPWLLAATTVWLLVAAGAVAAGGRCRSALELLEWLPMLAVPVTWLLFVLQCVRDEHRAPPPRWWWWNVAPLALAWLLVVSNALHGLVAGPEPAAAGPRGVATAGVLAWSFAAWSYGLVAAGLIVLLRAAGEAERGQRALWAGLAAAAVLPLLLHAAEAVGGLQPFGPGGKVLGCAVAVAATAWLVRRSRLFAVVPLARRLLFTELPDPVLVLDSSMHVVDANVCARQLASSTPLLGTPLAEWPRFGTALLQHLASAAPPPVLVLADPIGHYTVHPREIRDGTRRSGTLVRLHDVTAVQPVPETPLPAISPPAAVAALADPPEATALAAFLHEQTMRDPLTGLLNQRALGERFEQEAGYARTNGQTLALVLLDVDHLTRINDQHGHAAGDHVLRDFSAALRTGLRASDAVFRIGGEEFALLLPGADAPQAARRLQALRERLDGRKLAGLPDAVTFSAGVAALEDNGDTLDELSAAARQALHQAKGLGRNRTVVAPASDPLP